MSTFLVSSYFGNFYADGVDSDQSSVASDLSLQRLPMSFVLIASY